MLKHIGSPAADQHSFAQLALQGMVLHTETQSVNSQAMQQALRLGRPGPLLLHWTTLP